MDVLNYRGATFASSQNGVDWDFPYGFLSTTSAGLFL